MSRSRSVAALAFAALAAGASPAQALLPSIEVTCCQMTGFGADRPECKAFARTAARCEVAIREFYEVARAFEAAQKRAAGGAAPSAGLRDSSGASVQSGSGQGWSVPSMAP